LQLNDKGLADYLGSMLKLSSMRRYVKPSCTKPSTHAQYWIAHHLPKVLCRFVKDASQQRFSIQKPSRDSLFEGMSGGKAATRYPYLRMGSLPIL